MERNEFLKRCDEIIAMSFDEALAESSQMTQQERQPIFTIFGRSEDVASIFWKESVHKIDEGDVLAPHIITQQGVSLLGLAIWRNIELEPLYDRDVQEMAEISS